MCIRDSLRDKLNLKDGERLRIEFPKK